MSRAGNLRRNAVSRTLIFLIAVVQLAIAATPHTGLYSGASSRNAHLHATGDRLELIHDEAACPACSNINLIAHKSLPVQVGLQPFATYARATVDDDSPRLHKPFSRALSRAPPRTV
ncbi:MAG TPA: hypothetical protein VM100_05835 [Longimicrobiales bacterium]|nr:hypothetical protein [Longimicrobiales bacterium]